MIHAFNERGFDALDPKWSGGPPGGSVTRRAAQIVTIARCDPRFLQRPFSTWSLVETARLPDRGEGRRGDQPGDAAADPA